MIFKNTLNLCFWAIVTTVGPMINCLLFLLKWASCSFGDTRLSPSPWARIPSVGPQVFPIQRPAAGIRSRVPLPRLCAELGQSYHFPALKSPLEENHMFTFLWFTLVSQAPSQAFSTLASPFPLLEASKILHESLLTFLPPVLNLWDPSCPLTHIPDQHL